uniref:NIF system FeS cluster assembly NifU N-terminal domain-containing protein n=1 Tax=Piliocolobus tephrosceles TaxID=591936 RepID=A0A8C9IML5_9PRIM
MFIQIHMIIDIDTVKDHFNKPRNVGSFDKNEKNIGTSIVGKASCGDVIKLQLKIEGDVIKDARFMAFGCGSAIASSSYATELIKGKTIDEALKIKNNDIASHLSLPPVKIHCIFVKPTFPANEPKTVL